jgi:hypothetical protein
MLINEKKEVELVIKKNQFFFKDVTGKRYMYIPEFLFHILSLCPRQLKLKCYKQNQYL